MRPTRLAALALCLALPQALAAAAPAAGPESEDEKIVYALGAAMAQNVSSFALTPEELEIFQQGFMDEAQGRKLAVELEEYGPKLNGLRTQRMQVAAEAERGAAAAFVTKAAAEPGARKTESGFVYREVKAGEGATPSAEDTVRVHYHGTLRDGSVFDSSVERGEPAVFPLNRVIPCWTEALQMMKVGTKAVITCPAELAYKDRGHPPQIAPGAALRFEVELLGIE